MSGGFYKIAEIKKATTATVFAAETRAYFTEFEMVSAPYLVTNVITDSATRNISDNLPGWYKKGSESVFAWDSKVTGSVDITSKSLITLAFTHKGVVLTQLDDSIKSLDDAAWEEIAVNNSTTTINNISDFITITNDKLETNEYGDTNYKEGTVVQFKKSGTYLMTVKGTDGQTNNTFEY